MANDIASNTANSIANNVADNVANNIGINVPIPPKGSEDRHCPFYGDIKIKK